MKELIDGRIFWISVCITLIIAVTGIGLLAAYEQMHSFAQGGTLADAGAQGSAVLGEDTFSKTALLSWLTQVQTVASAFPPAKLLFWLYDRAAALLFFIFG